MARDLSDNLTVDLLGGKSSWGGQRPGAGRKASGTPPRQQLGYRIHPRTITLLDQLAKTNGHDRADLLAWIVENHKEIPENLTLQVD